MSTLIGRAWVPMVMLVVVAVGALAVSWFRGVFGWWVCVSGSGSADLIVRFEPARVICEVYGPVGRVAGAALRCWAQPAGGVGDRCVTDALAKGV
jgi:hypothetical protein